MFEMLLEENGEVSDRCLRFSRPWWMKIWKKRLLRHLKTVAYRQETWYRFSVWHFVFSKSWRRLFLANRVQFLILISKKLRSSFGLIIIDSGFPYNQKLRSNFYPNFPKKERQIIINLFCLLFLSLRRGKSFRPISFCSRLPQSVVERLQLFIFKPVSTFIVQSSTTQYQRAQSRKLSVTSQILGLWSTIC